MTLVALDRTLHEKPWGRTDLPARFGSNGRRIGEAWYAHPDRHLPLMVKWLFTSDRLSIQVHPDDELARIQGLAGGKEEWWFVIEAEPDANLAIGTKRALDAAELKAAALDGSLEQLMDWKPVKAGDWFHVAPGTVHAIGPGITLVEIQQNVDVTFRLFDYGRPRELHLDVGVIASDAKPYTDPRHGSVTPELATVGLSRGPSFSVFYGDSTGLAQRQGDPVWFIPIDGFVTVNGMDHGAGSVLYGQLEGPFEVTQDFRFLMASAAP